MKVCTIPTPIGNLSISGSENGLQKVHYTDERVSTDVPDELKTAICQLNEYFDGLRKQFDIPLVLEGTDFQLEVWDELLKMPYGNLISYQQLASQLGCPNKIRAVANANAANPIMIIVPCHRIIGSSGHLTGYAGGIKRKEWLLQHEQGMQQLMLF